VFARRSSWDLRANRLALALGQRQGSGAPVLDLTVSNPTRAGVGATAEIGWALARVVPATYLPAPLGLPEARAAVAEYYAGRGQQVAPEQVVLTASTSEAYGYLFKLLADPGDNVLVPRPSYPLFDFLAALEGVQVRRYPLRDTGSGWETDVDRLAAAIDGRTRAIVLVNPNNPTGSYVGAGDRSMIERLAGECDLALIVDEVFNDYPLEPLATPPPSFGAGEAPLLTFTLSGLSKVLAAPQLKLSWLTVGGPAARQADALARLEVIADTYLSVATQVQLALPALMHLRAAIQASVRRRLEGNLQVLRAACGAHPAVRCLRVEGGWYAVLRVDQGDDEELALRVLAETGVLVHPGYFYDFATSGYLVVSLLAPQLAAGIERLLNLLGA